MDLRLNLEGLTELQLADILVAGRLSKTSDDSTASPSMLIKSLRWGFKQLQIEPFSITFGSLISSFQMKVPRDRRESLPFGLYILTQFERRILVRETPTEEVLVLGSYLLLLFSGLRYSDLQRTSPTSLQWHGTTLRGLAWRTKTSCAGTPFGALACGFLSIGSYNWLYKWLVHLDRVLASSSMPSIDFMIPSVGPEGVRNPVTPMSYAESLFFLRHFLTLPWKKCPLDLGTSPQSYTIHGLKSTLISWATQLDLPDEHKRLKGKHQSRNSSTRLYSRDDVHGALKLQQADHLLLFFASWIEAPAPHHLASSPLCLAFLSLPSPFLCFCPSPFLCLLLASSVVHALSHQPVLPAPLNHWLLTSSGSHPSLLGGFAS